MTAQMRHGAKCIEPRFVDLDQLALIIAQAYGLTDPVEFDYETAQKVMDYVLTCSKAGQITHYLATGMTPAEIGVQLDMTEGYVHRLMREMRET